MTRPTLVEFLTARLDEDEAVAQAATNFPWRYHSGLGVQAWRNDGLVSKPTPYRVAAQVQSWDGPHIARHDPARVLADVKAKRAIVEDYRELRRQASAMAEGPMGETARNMYAGLKLALGHLASVYSDHPDYDATWAP
jgi:hypothetical protein